MPEVTFEVRDEVYEWLEAQADDQMMNISSTVEQLLVQKYKDEIKEQTTDETGEGTTSPSDKDETEDASGSQDSTVDEVEDITPDGESDVDSDRITLSPEERRELLEHVKEKEQEDGDEGESETVDAHPSEDDEETIAEEEELNESETMESKGDEGDEEEFTQEYGEAGKPILEKYAEHWYVADADSGKYALRVPDDAEISRDIKYYQNKETLQDGITRFYVDRPEVWR